MPARVRVQRDAGTDSRLAPREDLALVRRAARATLEAMNVRSGELSITLADDDIMIRLNRGYLKREGTTDVMAFPLWAGDEPPLGDVYIGLQQAARQADALGVPLREELARLAIHGSLHVLGLDHPEDAAREDSEMWRVQERILRSVMET